MARVTYVKRAQQRYQTVPVIDEATGKQKRTPITGRDGQQKHSKRGPMFRSVTIEDTTKPLPLYICDYCRKPIEIGTSYKHITPKSGPYGGTKRTRHADCPTWQVWEYSNSLSARTAQIAHDFQEAIGQAETPDDVTNALSEAAGAVRDIASEKNDGADNIESGFGHETSTSQELRDVAEQLETWADEIENVEVPDLPDTEEQDCEDCEDGKVDGEDCETCGGEGRFTPDEPTEDQIDDWRSQVEDACSIVDECPV